MKSKNLSFQVVKEKNKIFQKTHVKYWFKSIRDVFELDESEFGIKLVMV